MFNLSTIQENIYAVSGNQESQVMPYLQEPWTTRHSAVREMWSNPNFSLSHTFKKFACWWVDIIEDTAEYRANKELYNEMKAHNERTSSAPHTRELWWIVDQFFCLYYLEFPFKASNLPTFNRDSKEDFLMELQEIEQELSEGV